MMVMRPVHTVRSLHHTLYTVPSDFLRANCEKILFCGHQGPNKLALTGRASAKCVLNICFGNASCSRGVDVGGGVVGSSLHLVKWAGIRAVQGPSGTVRGDARRATVGVNIAGSGKDKRRGAEAKSETQELHRKETSFEALLYEAQQIGSSTSNVRSPGKLNARSVQLVNLSEMLSYILLVFWDFPFDWWVSAATIRRGHASASGGTMGRSVQEAVWPGCTRSKYSKTSTQYLHWYVPIGKVSRKGSL